MSKIEKVPKNMFYVHLVLYSVVLVLSDASAEM